MALDLPAAGGRATSCWDASPSPAEGLASGVITVRAAGLEQTGQVVRAGTVRVISLEHTRTIVIGQETAEQGIGPLIPQLLRHNQLRRGPGVYVAAGRAEEIFRSNHPVGEANPMKFMEGLLRTRKRVHLSPPIRMQHVFSRTR